MTTPTDREKAMALMEKNIRAMLEIPDDAAADLFVKLFPEDVHDLETGYLASRRVERMLREALAQHAAEAREQCAREFDEPNVNWYGPKAAAHIRSLSKEPTHD